MAYDTARAVIRAAKKLNAGAFIFEIARSEIGYTEQRPHEYAAVVLGRGAARGLRRARSSSRATTSRPTRRSTTAPDRDKELDGAARADQGRDRRRLLQHRHRHLDARRSRQGDARRAAGGQRQRSRPTSPRSSGSTSRRASRCRSAARSARSAARTPTSTSCTPTWSGFNAALEDARRGARRPQQDQRADRDGARRLRQRRRHACGPT